MSRVSPVERFDGKTKWPPWTYHQHYARYAWACQHAFGKTVVDAACGTGFGSQMLLNAGAVSVTSLDIDPQAIRATHSAAPLATVLQGDVTDLPLPSASTDLYVSFETLEHVVDPEKCLAEAERILAPNGILVISTPNRHLNSPGATVRSDTVNPFHQFELTLSEFESMLTPRFDVLEICGQSFASQRYVDYLQRLASIRNLAVRVQQLRKLVIEIAGKSDHRVGPLRPHAHPDMFVALCRRRVDTQSR